MSELGLRVPTRNILTGAMVNWSVEEAPGDADRVEGLTLTWRNLSVFRKRKLQRGVWRSPTYEEVNVLHAVNGVATQGNLIAIMGASGAGKTSLLAAISRRDKSDTTGSLLLNGRPASPRLLAKISGFVPQQDLAVVDLHVREHMAFMARLMMDKRSSTGARARRVQQLLMELNVAGCIHTKLLALSGGERKRISLAVQLLNDPPILFCDEPTTGLDSWAASAVTSRLRRLSASGKMVICSIHQPASGVFEMFDQVIFLAAGRVAFQGTIDEAANFFSGLSYKCPIGFNQAEYYVSRLGVEVGRELESHERIRRICDEFRRSKMAAEIERKLDMDREGSPRSSATSSSIFDTGGQSESDPFERYLTLKKVGYFVQFYWLLWRNIVALRRNFSIWVAEFILLMGVGFMLAIPYMGITTELDQRDIQNVEGLMYLTVTEVIFMFIYAVFITFPHEVPVLLRESANGLYSPGPYYLSKMIFWIPRAIISPTLYSALVFCVVGLRGGFQGWCWFNFICILCANNANAYGLLYILILKRASLCHFCVFFIGSLLSATFRSLETAGLVSVPVDLMGIMFSGIFLNLASLSAAISWVKYLSPFYYGTEAISILQWDTIDDIKCVNVPGIPCIRTGAEVLKRFGYMESNFWIDVTGLCVMYCVSNSIAYWMVRRRSHRTPVY